MAGTKIGGRNAAISNKARYGDDYYVKIGAIGGKKGNTGGFASLVLCDCEYSEDLHKKAMCAGSKGGTKSRRHKQG